MLSATEFAGTGTLLVLCVAAWAVHDSARSNTTKEPGANQVEIQKLIEQLGDKNAAVRQKATQHLKEIGKAALPALQQATKSEDLEVSSRARRIIEEIRSGADRRAHAAVTRYLATIKGGQNGLVTGMNDAALAQAFSSVSFVAVRFRQFPVARPILPPLKAQNIFVVQKNGKLKHLTDSKGLESFFRSSLPPVKTEKEAKNAIRAWLALVLCHSLIFG